MKHVHPNAPHLHLVRHEVKNRLMTEQMDDTIKLTNEQIEGIMQNPARATSLRRAMGIKEAYWLSRAMDKIQSLAKPYFRERNEIIEKFAKRDEKGELVVNPKNGSYAWETPASEKAANDAVAQLRSVEVDLGLKKIPIDWNNDSKFTVEDMLLLGPLLVPPNEEAQDNGPVPNRHHLN